MEYLNKIYCHCIKNEDRWDASSIDVRADNGCKPTTINYALHGLICKPRVKTCVFNFTIEYDALSGYYYTRLFFLISNATIISNNHHRLETLFASGSCNMKEQKMHFINRVNGYILSKDYR